MSDTPSPQGVYVKRFSDRYLQSRETQMLDLLFQRGAPVPELIKSDVLAGEVWMRHGGQDLMNWTLDPARGAGRRARVLASAIDVAISVARHDVWQWDLALRNFVISTHGSDPHGAVRMIDFANAVSDLAPLCKPLWMLPSDDHHPLLVTALTDDWRAFLSRHGMALPADLRKPFDLPRAPWEAEWVQGMAVEQLADRWCVLTHAVARMVIVGLSPMADSRSQALVRQAQCLLGWSQESVALDRLQALVHELSRHDASMPESTATPQPVRKDVPVAAPDVVAQAMQVPAPAGPMTGPFRMLAPLVVVATGWWVVDLAWTVNRAAVGDFFWAVLGLSSAISLGALAHWKGAWGRRLSVAVAAQALAQLALGAHLWILKSGHLPMALTLAACPIVALGAMAWARLPASTVKRGSSPPNVPN